MINAMFCMLFTGLLISILKWLQRSKKYGWFDLTICTIHLLGFIVDFTNGEGYFHKPTEGEETGEADFGYADNERDNFILGVEISFLIIIWPFMALRNWKMKVGYLWSCLAASWYLVEVNPSNPFHM